MKIPINLNSKQFYSARSLSMDRMGSRCGVGGRYGQRFPGGPLSSFAHHPILCSYLPSCTLTYCLLSACASFPCAAYKTSHCPCSQLPVLPTVLPLMVMGNACSWSMGSGVFTSEQEGEGVFVCGVNSRGPY